MKYMKKNGFLHCQSLYVDMQLTYTCIARYQISSAFTKISRIQKKNVFLNYYKSHLVSHTNVFYLSIRVIRVQMAAAVFLNGS